MLQARGRNRERERVARGAARRKTVQEARGECVAAADAIDDARHGARLNRDNAAAALGAARAEHVMVHVFFETRARRYLRHGREPRERGRAQRSERIRRASRLPLARREQRERALVGE